MARQISQQLQQHYRHLAHGAELLLWIDRDGADVGYHVACRVTLDEGERVVDTTWKQFDVAARGNDVFIGTVQEWERLIMSYQGALDGRRQRCAAVPDELRMDMDTFQYFREWKAARRAGAPAAGGARAAAAAPAAGKAPKVPDSHCTIL